MDQKHSPYETVPITDDRDHEESLSMTEVDESLMGDEKPWAQQGGRRSRETKSWLAAFRSHRWLIDTSLLVVILVLVLLLHRERRKDPSTTPQQVGGDFGGNGPQFATQVVKFESDMSFTPMNTTEWFSNDTLARWNTIMPAGTGWGSSEGTFFTTSMTHQLHCVFMMGRIYSGVKAGMADNLPDDYHFHFMHCIDYLRQGIMCTGDLALEPHEPNESEQSGGLDGGWNGHHVCKDYSQVIKYLEKEITSGVRVVLDIDD
ncbi:uncharacterized protein E0L32_007687 [Thyridium curvatum]|uniref:Oxidase ustYa n=1 Tax=Thyridium curvatum TaxID=1093900 RepID=A0A507B4B4_9PEZI|nr:uncharacterized protein E0L32_007687 [Thyridium curvatum]TPX11708.1 hypothetical protein E0L32_007687 [Thyridium curvatum]